VSGIFAAGGTVTYTVVLSNSGTGAQGDNPGDEFLDTLPAGLTLVSATSTSGTATAAANVVHWNGTLAAGGSVTITIVATIDAGATGTIVNQGTVNYDSDGNGSNDASALSDDPALPGAADGTGFVIAGPAVFVPVPALDRIAMGLLALGLAGLALRRRATFDAVSITLSQGEDIR
jgi:uncharacterized repeat protein (TIGR01451 family)